MGGDLVQLQRLKPKGRFHLVLRDLTDPYSASFVEFIYGSRPLTKTIDRPDILGAFGDPQIQTHKASQNAEGNVGRPVFAADIEVRDIAKAEFVQGLWHK